MYLSTLNKQICESIIWIIVFMSIIFLISLIFTSCNLHNCKKYDKYSGNIIFSNIGSSFSNNYDDVRYYIVNNINYNNKTCITISHKSWSDIKYVKKHLLPIGSNIIFYKDSSSGCMDILPKNNKNDILIIFVLICLFSLLFIITYVIYLSITKTLAIYNFLQMDSINLSSASNDFEYGTLYKSVNDDEAFI
jgi:hypothetical protein